MNRRSRASRRMRSRCRGQAFVELALCLGLLLLILGGVIEFGNATVETFSISDAARAGARFASRHSDPSAWTTAQPAGVATIPWAVQVLAPTVHNEWPSFVNDGVSQPANPPLVSSTNTSGIAITYLCSLGCPSAYSGQACGYYLPNAQGVYTAGFQLDPAWHNQDTANNDQTRCVGSGNLVKVGVTYLLPPLTRLLTGIAPAGFTLSYATTMPIQ